MFTGTENECLDHIPIQFIPAETQINLIWLKGFIRVCGSYVTCLQLNLTRKNKHLFLLPENEMNSVGVYIHNHNFPIQLP